MTPAEKQRAFDRRTTGSNNIPILPPPQIPDYFKRRTPEAQAGWVKYDQDWIDWVKSLFFGAGGGQSTVINVGGGTGAGPKGDKGEKGDPGEKGDKGDKGDQGNPGEIDVWRVHYWIAKRTDGKPGQGIEHDPFDGSDWMKFDRIMRSIPAYSVIHIGPGVFETEGSGIEVGYPAHFWRPKPGWKIRGSGIEVTTLKLVNADVADSYYWIIANTDTNDGLIDDFEFSDMTLDANLPGQPGAVAAGGFFITGNRQKVERVWVRKWGAKTTNWHEGIGCGGAATGDIFGDIYNFWLEDIIVSDPSTAGITEDPPSISTAIVVGGEHYDRMWANGTITRVGQDATVNTGIFRHSLRVGRWVALRGATQTEYNGSFRVKAIVDEYRFVVEVTGSPATPATGDPEALIEHNSIGQGHGDVHGLVIKNCFVDNEDLNNLSTGIQIEGAVDALIEGNTVRNVIFPYYVDTYSGESNIWRHNVAYNCESGFSFGLAASDGHHWTTMIFEDNIVELMQATTRASLAEPFVKGQNTFYPTEVPKGFEFAGIRTTRPYSFEHVYVRRNIVRFVDGAGGDYPAVFLRAESVDNLIIEDNICDLTAPDLIEVGTIGNVIARNNRKSDGTIILVGRDGTSSKFYDMDIDLDRHQKLAILGI